MEELLVKRNGKVAFMDVSTTSIANFLRMTKFTEISKSKNATEYSRTYVDEDGEVTDVTGYSEEISYAFDLYKNNLVHSLQKGQFICIMSAPISVRNRSNGSQRA